MSAPSGIEGIDDLVEIGRGGFGTVYRGVERRYGRDVAVKVLTAALTEEAAARFSRELRAMGSVSGHPNIVTVFRDGTTDDGQPYIVMEFLPGGSFADLLDVQGSIAWRDVAEIGARLADALHAAHAIGMVHRDVKPDNVFRSAAGEPKLGDFGIARIDDGFQTRSGVITASIAHAPPEVLDGVTDDVRSDVYSLASTLYTMVSGRTPFTERHEDVSLMSLIGRISRDVPPELDLEPSADAFRSVLRRGLSKLRDDRPATAAQFADELRNSLRGIGPTPAEPSAGHTIAVAPDAPGAGSPPSPASPGTAAGSTAPSHGPAEPPTFEATDETPATPAAMPSTPAPQPEAPAAHSPTQTPAQTPATETPAARTPAAHSPAAQNPAAHTQAAPSPAAPEPAAPATARAPHTPTPPPQPAPGVPPPTSPGSPYGFAPQPPASPPSGGRRWLLPILALLAIIGGVIAVVALGGTNEGGGNVAQDPTPAPVPSATAEPDDETTPTTAPQATATPRPTSAPTSTPAPTATPRPTSTSVPLPTPLPVTSTDLIQPPYRERGLVTVPLAGRVTFELDGLHPITQHPGHTIIYIDESLEAEVGLFEINADASGARLPSFDSVIESFEADPRFANMIPQGATTLGGLPALGYAGRTTTQLQLGFYTSAGRQGNDGWYLPDSLEIWFVDTGSGALAITSEAIFDFRPRYGEASVLLDEVLRSVGFPDA